MQHRASSAMAAAAQATLGNPTTTRFGWLNARKKHNLPYIETIHIQLGRCYVAALRRPSGERFIIVPWKMLKSFLKKRMLNPFRNWVLTSTIWFTSTTKELAFKITEKVSFNIASEASFVYILSGQKLIKKAKNCPIWLVFENLKLAVKQCYQTGQF